MRDRAAKGGGWQSTSGPAPLIVINGPIRGELGINSTGGIFAAGFRPNATIPRALGLMLRNAFGVAPHVFDQTTQGIPGRWAICFGENEEESPWEPLATEIGPRAGHERGVGHADPHVRVRRQPPHPEPRAAAVRLRGHDLADRLLIFRAQSAGRRVLPRARPDARRRRLLEGRRQGLADRARRPQSRPTCGAPARTRSPRAAPGARSASEEERARPTRSRRTSRPARTFRSSSPARATRRSRWSSACSASGRTRRWRSSP